MDKSIPTVNQKRSSPKQMTKTKKKQHPPLKVVYITNPIKFKATASEFRALVQELTGQDADMSDSSVWFPAGAGGGEEAKVAAGEIPPGFGSPYDDVFCRPEMVDGSGPGFVGCHEAAAHLDVFKSLDAL